MFSWQPADAHDRRSRAVAALVLIVAGWAIGFFAGRMSAWVFPVTDSETIAVETIAHKAPNVAPATAAPPQVADEKQTAGNSPPAAQQLPPERTQAAESSNPDRSSAEETVDGRRRSTVAAEAFGSPNAAGDRGASTAAASPTMTGPSAVLINPEWKQAKQRTQEDERRISSQPDSSGTRLSAQDAEDARGYGPDVFTSADEAAMRACERRYRSFRRSDGTYQPYDSRSRELCPYLR